MRTWLRFPDGVLRAEPWVLAPAAEAETPAWRRLLALGSVMLGFGLIYGGLMGTFGGVTPDRLPQIAFSAVKVPMLLGITFAISLPSFFVVNTLLGLRDDFGQVVRALVATQAGLTIVLAALGPLTVFWYLSVPDYALAKLFNGLVFLTASVAGQVQLARHYRPLIARNPAHRWTLRIWVVIYTFVGIQLGWTLRPFIGAADLRTTFFRQDAWTNAYVEVARLVWSLLGG